ncbi:hypothetical protein GN244_ATG11773 [Phytophthora infestans]|uniref:Uncharacterized protein n=1 Tax=Phytophthora infestans TaxID=4787 RepID=A0A833T1A4_PHYIN|nr:hypothetical protein GN244_ATG11773 [Phytophthora infestans]
MKQQEGSEPNEAHYLHDENTSPATSNSVTSEAAPEGGTSASINGEDEDGALEDYGQPNPAGVSLLRRGFGGRRVERPADFELLQPLWTPSQDRLTQYSPFLYPIT